MIVKAAGRYAVMEKMNVAVWLIPLTLVSLLCGCGGSSVHESGPHRGSAQMIRLLAKIAEDNGTKGDVFRNDRLARNLETSELSEDPLKRVPAVFNRAVQYLLAGRTNEAIELLFRINQEIEGNPAPFSEPLARKVAETLAVAYLRQGEQNNCLAMHNPRACIFPIQGDGIHQDRRGSSAAVTRYLALLEKDPGSLKARWLLNLAYMTLGRYPHDVPEQWLIAPEAFRSDYEIPSFHDVAMATGSAVRGLAGGVICEDFNNDGLLDIICSSWGLGDPLRYLENTPEGRFIERTESAGLKGITGGLNLVQADYDNDGRIDVLVLRGAWRNAMGLHPNSLLRNLGGSFVDVTQEAGLLDFSPTQTAAWGDYDNDGLVDLFVGNESSRDNVHPCRLYRNDGGGTFSDVTAEAGLGVIGYVKAVVWGDYDNDGFIDLYITRLDGPNRLFRNGGRPHDGKGWTFIDVTEEAGVGKPMQAFPAWFFDYDNDGWLDLFVSSYGRDYLATGPTAVAADYLGLEVEVELPRLYRGQGNGRFQDVTEPMGLKHVFLTMGCGFGDLDNDGWLDFYLGTGAPDFQALVPNLMFRNQAARVFQDVTTAGGFGHLQKGHGIAFADLDNDGDQDIYAVMGGAFSGDFYPNALFENPGFGNHWLTLLLEGVQSSRDAIGARIRLMLRTANGDREIHTMVSSGGSFGASSLRQEIGLGAATGVAFLQINWPVTGMQRLSIPAMDSAYRIREGQTEAEPLNLPKAPFAKPGVSSLVPSATDRGRDRPR